MVDAKKVEVNCCILQYIPNIKRREFINVGLVSFVGNSVDVVLTSQKERIISTFPEVNIEEFAAVVFEIKTLMQLSEDYLSCYERLKSGDIPDFRVSPIATFKINDDIDSYKKAVEEIIGMYVNAYEHKIEDSGRLNVYSPLTFNLDGFVIGTREGLIALRSAIDKALINRVGVAKADVHSSDGEIYTCKVMRVEDNDMPVMEPMYKNDVLEECFGMLTPEELYLRKIRKHEGMNDLVRDKPRR